MRGVVMGVLAGGLLASCQSTPVATSEVFATSDDGRPALRSTFWEARGVRLVSSTPTLWAAEGAEVALGLQIQNTGTQTLHLVLDRRTGWGWFGGTEEAPAFLDVEAGGPVLGLGWRTQKERQDLPRDSLDRGEVVIGPGELVTWTVPVPMEVEARRPYRQASLRAVVFPLSVRWGTEPERLVALPFPPAELHVVPPESLAGSAEDDATWRRLETLRGDDYREWAGLALRLATSDPIRVTDGCMSRLPAEHAGEQGALIAVLEHVTGQRFGGRTVHWQSWWASQDGARWAMSRRRGLSDGSASPSGL